MEAAGGSQAKKKETLESCSAAKEATGSSQGHQVEGRS